MRGSSERFGSFAREAASSEKTLEEDAEGVASSAADAATDDVAVGDCCC